MLDPEILSKGVGWILEAAKAIDKLLKDRDKLVAEDAAARAASGHSPGLIRFD